MRQILSIAVAIVIAVPQVLAIDIFKKGNTQVFDYTAWCDTVDLAVSFDGLDLFYPVTVDDEVTVSGEIAVPGLSSEKIFLGALNYAAVHLDQTNGNEQLGEINPAEKSFVLRLYSRQGTNNNETTFTRLMLVKAEDQKILFRDMQIDVRYREKGLIPRTVAFEKLNPASNSRHRELVEQFAVINARYLYDMASGIAGDNDLEVTHWKEILDRNVVKGMNQFEVLLILGRPVSERDNGDRVRWIYPNNYVLLFVEGKLIRIVE